MSMTYYLYRLNERIGHLLSSRINKVKYIRYLYEHGKPLTTAQKFEVLRDVDAVMKHKMKLSAYVDKWGTMFLDEKIWPLMIDESVDEPKKEEQSSGIFSRPFRPTFVACAFGLLLFTLSCSTKEEKSNYKETELPRSYVYVDFLNILHVKSDCPGIARRSNAQPVAPVHIFNIESRHLDKVCSRCVHEADIRELTAIIENNKELNEK